MGASFWDLTDFSSLFFYAAAICAGEDGMQKRLQSSGRHGKITSSAKTSNSSIGKVLLDM